MENDTWRCSECCEQSNEHIKYSNEQSSEEGNKLCNKHCNDRGNEQTTQQSDSYAMSEIRATATPASNAQKDKLYALLAM